MITPTITDPATLARITQLQAQITALEDGIASGVLRVSYNGISTEYADIISMKQALNFVRANLNRLINPQYRKPTVGVAHYSNGYRFRRGGWGGGLF